MVLTIAKYIFLFTNSIIASNYFIEKTKEDNTPKNIAKQLTITFIVVIISSILITLLFDVLIPCLPDMVENVFQQTHEAFNQANGTD